MHSSFKGASANCRIYYGPAPAMTYPDPKEMPREAAISAEGDGGPRRAVEQIAPMPIQNIPPDQFGLDEVDRAELRRMEPNAVRELMPYIRRESDRMESEGNILRDESLDAAHVQRGVENIMRQLGVHHEPGGYMEEMVTLMLLSEIFDRRRRCRRMGVCGR